jgi:predicted ATPase
VRRLFTRARSHRCSTSRGRQAALLEAVRSGAERNTLFAAALDELEARPTLVVFEDLHWADEATLDFLKFAGRRIARTALLVDVSG